MLKNWSKNKPKINLVIDVIMFIALMAVAGLGFLMKYVLLPGYKINELYDTNTDLLFLGLDRHQWGAIHLYIALFMIFLLTLHLILHWDTILCIFRRMIPSKTARIVIAVVVGVLSIFLVLAPFNVNPEVVPLARKYMHNRVPERIIDSSRESYQKTEGESGAADEQRPPVQTQDDKGQDYTHHQLYEEIDINGTMTLVEISKKYNISVNELAAVINIPAQYANERLGRLRKSYGFDLDDLRSFVIKVKSKDID